MSHYATRVNLEIFGNGGPSIIIHSYFQGTVTFSDSGLTTLSESEGNENIARILKFINDVRIIDDPSEKWVPSPVYEEAYSVKMNGTHELLFKAENFDTKITHDPVTRTSTIFPRQSTVVTWPTYLRFVGALLRFREIRHAQS